MILRADDDGPPKLWASFDPNAKPVSKPLTLKLLEEAWDLAKMDPPSDDEPPTSSTDSSESGSRAD